MEEEKELLNPVSIVMSQQVVYQLSVQRTRDCQGVWSEFSKYERKP